MTDATIFPAAVIAGTNPLGFRLFQNSGINPAYGKRLHTLTRGLESFSTLRDAFLNDRFGACHFLKPVLDGNEQAFFTNGNDAHLQQRWAREHGLPSRTSLTDILLAQIEHHRTEVFYNLDPVHYPNDLARRLPGSVRKTLAWRAAPSPGADFGAYDLVVCNFPAILEAYKASGWKTAWFAPAHDPVMDGYAANNERPVDVIFVGGYSRHHRRRAELLEAVASLRGEFNVVFHLDASRLTRLAESPLGRALPLSLHRRPSAVRAAAQAPVYGVDLYRTLSRAKIVLNGAIDMAGHDRGNMRCFEAMGCGNLLLSDAGNYPEGMIPGSNLSTYSNPGEAVDLIRQFLEDPALRTAMAQAGHEMIASDYSKSRQWDRFVNLIQ